MFCRISKFGKDDITEKKSKEEKVQEENEVNNLSD
jgi:hypothetical protein